MIGDESKVRWFGIFGSKEIVYEKLENLKQQRAKSLRTEGFNPIARYAVAGRSDDFRKYETFLGKKEVMPAFLELDSSGQPVNEVPLSTILERHVPKHLWGRFVPLGYLDDWNNQVNVDYTNGNDTNSVIISEVISLNKDGEQNAIDLFSLNIVIFCDKALLYNADWVFPYSGKINHVKRNEVFICYARADSDIVNELKDSLTILKRNHSKIEYWYDGMIQTGKKWRDEVKLHLQRAKVAILMVSEAFLRSEFIYYTELPELLKAAENTEASIIWVPVTHSQVNEVTIKNEDGSTKICIADYQCVCEPENPLRAMSLNERNKVYISICQDIKRAYKIL